MRIISGIHKGRRIHIPGNLPVRPTTDVAKEALFNILSNFVSYENTHLLDLFAGTGCISYEFASRGCKQITSVDINNKCCGFIRATASNLGFGNIKVVKADFNHFIKINKLTYNIIFADPPFDLAWTEEIPALILKKSMLEKGGLLIVEHPESISFKEYDQFTDHRRYGMVNFSFFEKE